MPHLLQCHPESQGRSALTVRANDLYQARKVPLGMTHGCEHGFYPLETEGDVTAPVQLGTDLGERGHGRNGRLLDVFVETAGERLEHLGVDIQLLALPALYLAAAHLVGEQDLHDHVPRGQRSPARAVPALRGSHPGQSGEDALVDALWHQPFELAVYLRLGPERANRRYGPPCAVEQTVGLLVFERGVRLRITLRREQCLFSHYACHLLRREGHDGVEELQDTVEDLAQDAGRR